MPHFNELNNNWCSNWFNTIYYHTLYKNRNEKEAQLFIDTLLKTLSIPKQTKILDLACGKGRHAIYLNKLGYDVKGIDISPANIACASVFSNATLQFEVHDMKLPYRKNEFDYVLNLFTSFGYFDDASENSTVLKSVNQNLKLSGFLLIDFMNVNTLQIVKEEQKIIDGINFDIKRYIQNGYVIKEIRVRDKLKETIYKEQVQLLSIHEFEKYLPDSGFKIVNLFGDYQMNVFDVNQSPRLIILAHKIKAI